MTSYQIKKLTMFLALQNLIGTTAAQILALMPHFDEFFTIFKENVTLLLQQSVIQNQPIKGFTELKQAQKENMIDQTIAMTINIIAYATVTSNIEMKSAVSLSKSALDKLQDLTCIDTCKNIYKIAKNNIQALNDYNVTDQTILSLETAINDFSDIYIVPKEHMTIKKMATEDIKKCFTEASKQTTKMDALVKMIMASQSEFTNLYFQTRKIEKPAYTTLALKANVSDPNKKPIAKVLLTSEQITFPKPKFTSKLGNFQLKNLASNVYTITLSKAGYTTQTIQVPITAGERTQIKIILIPNL